MVVVKFKASKNTVPKKTKNPDIKKKDQYSVINSFRNFPLNPCKKFVTKEGIIIRVIAVLRSINNVSKSRLIVGKPIPMTPFTTPEKRNIINICKIISSVAYISKPINRTLLNY